MDITFSRKPYTFFGMAAFEMIAMVKLWSTWLNVGVNTHNLAMKLVADCPLSYCPYFREFILHT